MITSVQGSISVCLPSVLPRLLSRRFARFWTSPSNIGIKSLNLQSGISLELFAAIQQLYTMIGLPHVLCLFLYHQCSIAHGLLYEDQALGLNNKHLLFTLLEAEQSKIKVLGRACFLVCSLRAASSQHSSSSFYKDVRLIMRVPPLWPNLSLISSQRPHLLIPSHWGWELRCMNFEGDAFSPQCNHFHIANRNRGWWSVARIRGQEEAEEG